MTTAEIRLALAKRYQRPNFTLLREVANRIGSFPLPDGTTDSVLRYADYIAITLGFFCIDRTVAKNARVAPRVRFRGNRHRTGKEPANR